MLDWWERERIFDQLREQNRGGPRFSFIDGPITANNPMGVHHAWGRTLKDVFQRYKAMQGFDQRYQNGFDCQGLWVEVEVEKALGLNSKRDIERYGLAEFAERCKERVARYAEVITEQSTRLGMWMDWGNDYYTFTDTNIEYIWRLPQGTPRARLAVQGPPLDPVVPALRDLALPARAGRRGNYQELDHPSLYVRFPLRERRRREPRWSGRRRPGRSPRTSRRPSSRTPSTGSPRAASWWAVDARSPRRRSCGAHPARELVGLDVRRPLRRPAGAAGVMHRVIPWDEVSLNEGTGIVHIAPGCGAEDFELSQRPRAGGDHADRRGRAASTRASASWRGSSTDEAEAAGRSRASASAACCSRPGGSSIATRSAGGARRRSSSASPTTGSSRPTRSGSR